MEGESFRLKKGPTLPGVHTIAILYPMHAIQAQMPLKLDEHERPHVNSQVAWPHSGTADVGPLRPLSQCGSPIDVP